MTGCPLAVALVSAQGGPLSMHRAIARLAWRTPMYVVAADPASCCFAAGCLWLCYAARRRREHGWGRVVGCCCCCCCRCGACFASLTVWRCVVVIRCLLGAVFLVCLLVRAWWRHVSCTMGVACAVVSASVVVMCCLFSCEYLCCWHRCCSCGRL